MRPFRRHTLALGLVLGTCALPGAAQAAPSTCFADLPASEGAQWQIGADGSLVTRLAVGADRAFAAAHGALQIGGAPYPAIPNVPLGCDRVGNTLSYPARTFGVFEVSRSVSSAGGRLRHLDTVRNTTGQVQVVDLDWRIETTSSQVGFESEGGDATAGGQDDWFVLKDDALYPVLQWGEHGSTLGHNGRERPDVLAGGVSPWNPTFSDGDESAQLSYHADLSPNETVRFLHVSDIGTSSAAAHAEATDAAGSFAGYSKAVAGTVINYGIDADKDGVVASADDCPSVKGDLANGCLSLIVVPPVDPTDPPPAPGDPPPPPAGPGVAPGADTAAPAVTIRRLGAKVRRGRLATKGLRPRIACSEACSLTVRVAVRRKGAKRATTLRTAQRTLTSTAARTVTLTVKRSKLRRLRRQQITLVVVARDAAGNQTRTSRVVKLRR